MHENSKVIFRYKRFLKIIGTSLRQLTKTDSAQQSLKKSKNFYYVQNLKTVIHIMNVQNVVTYTSATSCSPYGDLEGFLTGVFFKKTKKFFRAQKRSPASSPEALKSLFSRKNARCYQSFFLSAIVFFTVVRL